MSKITGSEPKHWHDADGKHRMPDPRKAFGPVQIAGRPGEYSNGIPRRLWGDPDQVRYAEHLDAHDAVIPERRDDDSDAVRVLFNKIEADQAAIAKAGELIKGLREAGK